MKERKEKNESRRGGRAVVTALNLGDVMIKPRYNLNRIGATVFSVRKTTNIDHDYWYDIVKAGNKKGYTYRTKLDARVVAGKLLAHSEFSKLIKVDENSFTFVVDLKHPKNERELYIIGHDCNVMIVYKKRTNKALLNKVEPWLKGILRNVDPLPSVFTFGTNYKFGIAKDDRGVLMLTYQKPKREREYVGTYEDWQWDN